MKPEDRRFAKDVAKHIDRRRTGRKVAVYGGLAGAIALALSYLTCGGWGLGGRGGGKGSGPGSGTALIADAGPRRCVVRVTAAGITVNGEKATRGEVVKACKATAGAEVVVTGDAREGDWQELEAALRAAKIEILRREPSGASDGR
jgi:hypothetical protein